MPTETKQELKEILEKITLLTAACEGNMYHERTTVNEAIYNQAVEIQNSLRELIS